MRRRVLFVAVGAVIVGSGIFAATGIGGSDDKVTVGPTVHKEIERVSAADARAAGANVPFARARGAKKPKLSYFLATVPTIVPPNARDGDAARRPRFSPARRASAWSRASTRPTV